MVMRDYAAELAEDIYGENILAFDPLTILAIIQAIAAIVSLWKNCRPSVQFTADMMREYLNSGGPVRQRIRMRRMMHAVREELTADEIELIGGSEEKFVHYLIKSANEPNSNFAGAFKTVMLDA